MLLSAVPNPDYMNGTMIVTPAAFDEGEAELLANRATYDIMNGMQGTMIVTPAAFDEGEAELIANRAEYGDYGMGTTGSLGVNYAAPLTRGGFPGELFFSAPMPTGKWKDAPTPVMLGTDGIGVGIGSVLGAVVGLAFSVAVYYGAFKYYSGLWKERKRTANPSGRRKTSRRKANGRRRAARRHSR